MQLDSLHVQKYVTTTSPDVLERRRYESVVGLFIEKISILSSYMDINMVKVRLVQLVG